jgi:catechol 2,3-dioxygenase-like lactoylglutathione lyase family enzyme
MLLYITLGTTDLAKARAFYDAALSPLGYVLSGSDPDEIGYCMPGDSRTRIWVTHPYNREPASFGNGSMVALEAPSRSAVDAFFAAGLSAGGSNEGAPGLRPYSANFYAAYLRDPDGNKLSAVCERPE